MRMKLLSGLVMAVAFGAAAHATEFVTNGGFETVSGSGGFAAPTGSFEYDPLQPATDHGVVNGWTVDPGVNAYNLLYTVSTALGPTEPLNRWGAPGQYLAALPSNTGSMNIGNNFMGLDGDSGARGALQQTITGLSAGSVYVLTFDWAADQLADRTGATTEQLQVSLGGETHLTGILNDASQSATIWHQATIAFTATGSTEVLSFLSLGTPNGLPPMALLDNVSLTNTVPEPATWGLMLVGVAAVGASLRLRRRAASAAA
jgi:hypothetical protein